jgi:hypothetical protein
VSVKINNHWHDYNMNPLVQLYSIPNKSVLYLSKKLIYVLDQ